MASKKTEKPAEAADGAPAKPARVIIRAKTPMDFDALIKKAKEEAWRKLRVEIQIRDRLLAGKPASLDAANAMLKARGLEDQMVAVADIVDPDLRAKAAERIAKDEGLCEFTRRAGKSGIWMPSNHLKAMLKENWSVLGLRVEVRGSRGALAEGLFVVAADCEKKDSIERDWIYLGEKPDGVHQAVAHTVGPSGPVSSIKRHEYVEQPKIAFEIWIANAKSVSEKISDDELVKTLVHAAEHGTGSCRSQGSGKFDILEIRELGSISDDDVQKQMKASAA
jgi:hypothetical protein